jgi:hypothetical protein
VLRTAFEVGGESGTPCPLAANARIPPENKDSEKTRSRFATTAVYHRLGRFGLQSRTFSRHLEDGSRTTASFPVQLQSV